MASSANTAMPDVTPASTTYAPSHDRSGSRAPSNGGIVSPPKLLPMPVMPITRPLRRWNQTPTSLPVIGDAAPANPAYCMKLSAYHCHSSVISGLSTNPGGDQDQRGRHHGPGAVPVYDSAEEGSEEVADRRERERGAYLSAVPAERFFKRLNEDAEAVDPRARADRRCQEHRGRAPPATIDLQASQ